MNLPGIPVVATQRSAASCVGVTASVRTTARTRCEYVCACHGRERSERANKYLSIKVSFGSDLPPTIAISVIVAVDSCALSQEKTNVRRVALVCALYLPDPRRFRESHPKRLEPPSFWTWVNLSLSHYTQHGRISLVLYYVVSRLGPSLHGDDMRRRNRQAINNAQWDDHSEPWLLN